MTHQVTKKGFINYLENKIKTSQKEYEVLRTKNNYDGGYYIGMMDTLSELKIQVDRIIPNYQLPSKKNK